MDLVKFDETITQSVWKKRDKKATRHMITGEVIVPKIDYGKLRELINTEGLRGRERPTSTKTAHDYFMANYKQMFVAEEKRTGKPNHSILRSEQRLTESMHRSQMSSESAIVGSDEKSTRKETASTPIETHDIRHYTQAYRKQNEVKSPEIEFKKRIKTLRKLLRKLPFERTADENNEIFKCLKHNEYLTSQVSDDVLKELSVVAQIDIWKETGITIFGGKSWFLILRGTVRALSDYVHRKINEPMRVEKTTPEPEEQQELTVGDCFGTLDPLEGREANSKVLAISLISDYVELMVISATQHKRVTEQLLQRQEAERVHLLQSCKQFQLWPRQPLVELANALVHATFPSNTVLVSEGYNAPFAAIIKKGTCHVLKQITVLKKESQGDEDQTNEQVLMGKLSAKQTFGIISLMRQEPMNCTIVTATELELGLLQIDKVQNLDATTHQLLSQSSQPTYDHLNEDAARDEYIRQESKRRWNNYKHNTIVNVINARGIQPGYGKWAKN